MFKDLKATAGAWSFEILAFLVHRLPRAWRPAGARLAGEIFGRLSREMKTVLEKNLSTLLGMKGGQLRRVRTHVFRNFAETLFDFFFPDDVTVDAEDRQRLDALHKKHGGIMFLTFHMGHWELGARVLRQWGWPVTAIYQPYTNKKFKEVIEKRRAPGVHFIPVGGRAAAGVRTALRAGHAVAMLGDHPFGEGGTTVNLLGHNVVWPKGPVLLAVREQAPIVIGIIIRTDHRRYKALVEDPLFPRENTRVEVERLTQEVAAKFGKLLTQYPEQWYRFRPFEFVDNGV